MSNSSLEDQAMLKILNLELADPYVDLFPQSSIDTFTCFPQLSTEIQLVYPKYNHHLVSD